MKFIERKRILMKFNHWNVLAAALSYAKWHSFWLALGHCLCGSLYVIWYIAKYIF